MKVNSTIMSWNSYIDVVKAYSRDATGKEHIDRVCIIGLDGVRYTDDTHPTSLKVSMWYAFSMENIYKLYKSCDGSLFTLPEL